jgi:FkbM family methyltransferase
VATVSVRNNDHEITTVVIDGRRFGIAGSTDVAAQEDPVAQSYRAGDLRPVRLLLSVARAAVGPGARVLDLGAHVGGFTCAIAALGCRVLAIEASPRNVALLEASRWHNDFRDLHVEHAAVGDCEGEIYFHSNGPWGQVAPGEGDGSVRVPMTTIDAVLERHGWADADFVKLDVEGCEVRALRGASRLLGGANAPPVFFESNSHTLASFGETPESLRAEFLRHGYTVYHVRAGVLVPVRTGERQRKVCTDYLACKRMPAGLAAWQRLSLASLVWRFKHMIDSL